jgi:hypothetical protein
MGKTTKAEVKKVLDQNPPPRVEESVRGGTNTSDFDAYREPDNSWNIRRISDQSFVTNVRGFRDDPEGAIAEAARRVGGEEGTKYGEYQIPGGENYREILLKLPSNRPSMRNMSRDEYNAAVEAADRAGAKDYLSSHWDETPNVLAHARVSDRTGPNGERILHIEEIQSDWHQAGRKQGYLTPEKKAEIEAQQKAITKAESEMKEIQREYDRAKEYSKALDAKIASPEFASFPPEKQAQIRESAKSWGNAWLSKLPELMKARDAFINMPGPEIASRLVPDAPFKKSWHELTMKRLLNYAAENNYDRIAITPGAEQASRYDLSKHIDELVYSDDGTLYAAKGGKKVLNERVSPEELHKYIGKDAAEKLMKTSPNEVGSRTISGLDLQVGGEGMKGFYDKILPDYLNSLGKPYGASVGRMDVARPPANSMDVSGLPLGEEYIQGRATWSEFLAANPDAASRFSTPLHSFDITPQMRQEITSKGLPLYSVPAIEGAAATGAGAAMFGEQEKAPVHISDNPDTMRLELDDKQMAGGGIAKALRGAAKASTKKEPSLPLNLPRAAPKTKEEIRPIAQRMAQQMTGEFVRPDPTKSTNPAGKSLKRFQMEKDLEHDIRPTPGRNLSAQEVSNIEKQKGMLKIGVSGDTTISDKTLYRAGPYELDLPSPQHGGPLFALGGEGAWASNNPVAATFQKRVQELSQAHGDAPVLGQFVAMGPSGSNFALHFADANLRAIDLGRMTEAQIEAVNKLIREGSKKSGPRPSFPGIEDKESAYLHLAFDPELRKHFNAMMQKTDYTTKLGLPDGRVILHAITEPELRNTEVLTSGLSQMRLNPAADPKSLALSEHPTYSHVIPKEEGTPVGRTRYLVPAELEFPDVLEFAKKNYRPSDLTRVYQTATPRQLVDQQHIDEMRLYEELMKEYTGKKKGGVVKLAAGGLSKAAVDALTKMRSLSKEFAEKSAEHARYIQETKNVPTKQLPSFEEWKALQMNATPQNIEQLRKETGNKRGGSIKKKR